MSVATDRSCRLIEVLEGRDMASSKTHPTIDLVVVLSFAAFSLAALAVEFSGGYGQIAGNRQMPSAASQVVHAGGAQQLA